MHLIKKLWPLIIIIIVAAISVFIFNHIATSPGRVMMAMGGDGTKNYYNYLYHILEGNGIWFTGMNYPSGDHIVYSDAIPLFSVPLSYVNNIVPLTLSQALAFMHLMLVFSFFLAVVFIYRTLRKLDVARIAALLFATLIVSMSPQVLRMNGHYGLAYFCILPMVFYWLLSYYKQLGGKYAVYIFLMGITSAFIHPYFIALVFIFVLFYSLAYLLIIRHATIRQRLFHILPLIVSVVTVLLVFKTFMSVTDRFENRPDYPYGITQYGTVGDQILTSSYSPVWKAVKDNGIYRDVSEGGEGFAYIGLMTIIIVLVVVGTSIKQAVKKKKSPQAIISNHFPSVFLLVAFASLLLGMGVPFVWNMDWLIDYVSLFRQFRSMGRFSWIFYYIITVFAAVSFYRWYIRTAINYEWRAKSVIFLVFFIWAYEASGYIDYIRNAPGSGFYNYDFTTGRFEEKWSDFLLDNGHEKDDFHAILALPFFHVGSDKLWINGDSGWMLTLVTKASLQLRLGIVDVFSARFPWAQAFDKVKIAAGPIPEKHFLSDLPGNKPLLLLQADYDSISYDEKYLIEAADYIGEFSQCHVYALYPDTLRNRIAAYRNQLKDIARQLPAGDSCWTNTGPWLVQHYNKGDADSSIFSGHATKAIFGKGELIFQSGFTPAIDSQLYEFSLWALVNGVNYTYPTFAICLFDSSGQVLAEHLAIGGRSVDNEGMWFRVSQFFPVPAACRKIKCYIYDARKDCYYAMDELMLRPADATIFSKDINGQVMVNNHVLR